QRLGLGALSEIRDGLHVEVEDAEEAAVGRRVGAEVPGIAGEQGIDRIEADRVRPALGGGSGEPGEVREIAGAPVAVGAKAVKLDREPPGAPAFAAALKRVASRRCDDEAR